MIIYLIKSNIDNKYYYYFLAVIYLLLGEFKITQKLKIIFLMYVYYFTKIYVCIYFMCVLIKLIHSCYFKTKFLNKF